MNKAFSFRKNLSYIWNKYGWQTITAAFIVMLLSTLIWQEYFSSQPLLTLEMINGNGKISFQPFFGDSSGSLSPESIKINHRIQDNDAEACIRCDPNKLLYCVIAEGKTDVFFWNSTSLRHTLTKKALIDLRTVLPPEILKKYKNCLIYSDSLLKGGYPCAIQFKNNAWLQKNYNDDTCFAGISKTSENPTLAGKFLTFLLKIKNPEVILK